MGYMAIDFTQSNETYVIVSVKVFKQPKFDEKGKMITAGMARYEYLTESGTWSYDKIDALKMTLSEAEVKCNTMKEGLISPSWFNL